MKHFLNTFQTRFGLIAALLVGAAMTTGSTSAQIPAPVPANSKAVTDSSAKSRKTIPLLQHTVQSNPTMTLVLPSPSAPTKNNDAQSVAPSAADRRLAPHLADLQTRKQQSMNLLHQRAEELVQAWKVKQAREALAALKAQQIGDDEVARKESPPQTAAQIPAANQSEINPPVVNPNASADTASSPSDESATTDPQPAVPEQPVPIPTSPASVPPAAETSANAAEVMGIAATVDGPIDRIALATSLFATGSFRECLQTLEAVDRDQLTTENIDWCDYTAACCYRKMGDFPEAESRYRELLSQTEVSWLASAARWWLDHLNEQQKLRTDLANTHSTLQTWQGEIDAIRKTD